MPKKTKIKIEVLLAPDTIGADKETGRGHSVWMTDSERQWLENNVIPPGVSFSNFMRERGGLPGAKRGTTKRAAGAEK